MTDVLSIKYRHIKSYLCRNSWYKIFNLICKVSRSLENVAWSSGDITLVKWFTSCIVCRSYHQQRMVHDRRTDTGPAHSNCSTHFSNPVRLTLVNQRLSDLGSFGHQALNLLFGININLVCICLFISSWWGRCM